MSHTPMPVPGNGTITKDIVQAAGERLAQEALGETTAIRAAVILQANIRAFEAAYEQVKPQAMEEAARYKPQESTCHGVTFQVRGQGGRYSYKHDPEWVRLNAAIEAYEKRMRGVAETGAHSLADPETGELILAARKHPATDTLVLSFPNQR